MNAPQLYVVIQEPKRDLRHYVSFVWFTHADSKRRAVENYRSQCPGAQHGLGPAGTHKLPRAELVIAGGDPIRV